MITAVTTCMSRREHLEVTLPLMLAEFERVIVVDWSCPQESGKWAEKEGAQVVYKKGQEYFNASKARNLGARHVETRSICFLDADNMVMPGFRKEVESLLDLSSMIIAPRNPQNIDVHDLGGFIALDIGHFWGVKGYNESLDGYALEDSYLRAQLCLERGLKVKRVSPASIAVMLHSNALRGKHHKDRIEIGARRNYAILLEYLKTYGISDWTKDPRTAEAAHRTA